MNNTTITKNDCNKVMNKIIDLSLKFLNEEAKNCLNIICTKIKVCELQKKHLIENKPLFFQKKKIIEYNKKIEDINKEIFNCFKSLEEEIDLIAMTDEVIDC